MSSAQGPWSVKGIDPKAREIAKDLARRSGMTLGEWLNARIIADADAAPPPASRPTGPQALAPQPRPATGVAPAPSGDLRSLARALDALSQRMESAETRSAEAVAGVDRKLAGVLDRMDGADGEGARRLEELRVAQAELAERIGRAGPDDAPRRDALKSLEAALGKVAAQIYEGESRARAQIAETRGELAALGTRMEGLDAHAGAAVTPDDLERRLSGLATADEVSRRLDGVATLGELDRRLTDLARIGDIDRRLGGLASTDEVERRLAAAVAPEEMERRFADMAARLQAAEARTTEAVRGLEGSLAGLDRRIADAESRPAGDGGVSEQRFERLASELSDRVELARAEMAHRIRAAADGGLERMEQALRELAGEVSAAETRQVHAIDSMGREVVRIARSLDGRLGGVETRQVEGERRVGAEVARMADVVENRLRQGDEAQAGALERLGGEIARIAEGLADRIGASERRSVQTAEDAFEQLRGVSDRLNAKHEASAAEVSERIRTAEERTARLLDDTRPSGPPASAAFDPPLAPPAAPLAVYAPAVYAPAAAYPPAEPAPVAPASVAPASVAPALAAWSPPPESHAAADAAVVDSRPTPPPYDPFAGFDREIGAAAPAAAAAPFAGFDAAEPEAPPPADPFSAITQAEAAYDRFAPAAVGEDIFDAPHSEPARTSTRELIDQARQAARTAAETKAGGRRGRPELQALAAPGLAAAIGSPRGKGALPWLRKRDGGDTRTAVVSSLVAVSAVALSAGAFSLAHTDHGPVTTGEAPSAAQPLTTSDGQLAMAVTAPDPAIAAGPIRLDDHATPVAPDAAAPVTADAPSPVATSAPPPTAADAASPPAPTATGSAAKLAYADAVRRIEGGDASGVSTLRRAANLGYAPAQTYLAKLYEDGRAGLPKSVQDARTWTQRAAVGGDPHAMFNLGMFYAGGEGGPLNNVSAAAWFKRAADLGLHDAQFNLAVLSQSGRGVPKNLADAYKWYLVAASQGDVGARQAADAVKGDLSPELQAAAERAAAAYRTQLATSQVKAAAAN